MKSLNKVLADQDYIEKLNEADAAYIRQFNREFYASFGLKEPGTLHPEKYHKELYRQANHRRNDVLNQKSVVDSLNDLKKNGK